jgi:hypothetical protein
MDKLSVIWRSGCLEKSKLKTRPSLFALRPFVELRVTGKLSFSTG